MDPKGLDEIPDIARQVVGSGEIDAWATAVLVALALITLLRYAVKAWRREMWQRRIFWIVHLFVLPLSIFALVHVAGVMFETSTNADLAIWVKRGGDSVLAIVFAMLVVEGLDIIVWKGLVRHRFRGGTPRILVGFSAFIVYLGSAYIIAAVIFDLPVTAALVSSSIVLGIIALSLQNTISDIFAGVFISLERPFRIGDWIVTEDDRLGKVIEIDWRATRLLSLNNTVYVVPNSKIANSIIENRAEPSPVYGHKFHVHMAPEAPVDLVRRVLLEAVLSSPYVLSEPPPTVNLSRSYKRPYKYLVYVYFDKFETSWRGNGDVQARIHDYFKRAGLTVAGESREVLHRHMEELQTEELSIQQILGDVQLFRSLSAEELNQLSQHVRTMRYRPGDIVINEGESGDSLLVITNGLVDVTRQKPKGRQVRVSQLGMGQCIGEISLLTGSSRNATVRAITDCEVVEIPKEGLTELLENRPDMVDALAQTMAERRAADELIIYTGPDQANSMSLQEIADRFGNRIRSFFRL